MLIYTRRRRPRLVTTLKVGYGNARCTGSGTTLDVGMGGMFLEVQQPMLEGDWLELHFVVNAHGEASRVRCRGQILRTQHHERSSGGHGMPGIAVEFRQFLEGQEALREYLATQLELDAPEVGQPDLGPVPEEAFASEAFASPSADSAAPGGVPAEQRAAADRSAAPAGGAKGEDDDRARFRNAFKSTRRKKAPAKSSDTGSWFFRMLGRDPSE